MTTELVLNLWFVMEDRNHLVYAVAGKICALDGADHEKTSVLKLLAPTDYVSAQFFPVAERFSVTAPNGKIAGVATPAMLQTHLYEIYAEVLDTLERDLPEPIANLRNEPLVLQLQLPKDPLFVLTALIDDGKGRLRAAV